jgi:hypothetical protein
MNSITLHLNYSEIVNTPFIGLRLVIARASVFVAVAIIRAGLWIANVGTAVSND